MNNPKEKDVFLNTSCAGEVIRLSEFYDKYDLKAPEDNKYVWTLCMSFYNSMYTPISSVKHNLKHIWYILTKGTTWKDEIVLDLKTAENLRDTLTKFIDEAKKFAP